MMMNQLMYEELNGIKRSLQNERSLQMFKRSLEISSSIKTKSLVSHLQGSEVSRGANNRLSRIVFHTNKCLDKV